MKVTADTNVLVRAAVNVDEAQARVAMDLLRQTCSPDRPNHRLHLHLHWFNEAAEREAWRLATQALDALSPRPLDRKVSDRLKPR